MKLTKINPCQIHVINSRKKELGFKTPSLPSYSHKLQSINTWFLGYYNCCVLSSDNRRKVLIDLLCKHLQCPTTTNMFPKTVTIISASLP